MQCDRGSEPDISLWRIKLWPFTWKERRIKGAGKWMSQLFEPCLFMLTLSTRLDMCSVAPFFFLFGLCECTHKYSPDASELEDVTFILVIYSVVWMWTPLLHQVWRGCCNIFLRNTHCKSLCQMHIYKLTSHNCRRVWQFHFLFHCEKQW